MMENNPLKEKVSKLPTNPGVYQFLDANGIIIYIGKAKNLKNRVSSYFIKTNQSSKTMVLVRKIRDLRYVVVDSEQDALLLENNLIKKYKPRYNILLKDDKTYPWICITNEPFPRVFITRKFVRNGSEYFGPYTSAKFAHTLITLIKSLYKLRTCNLSINKSNIYDGKYKVCLEYHIGNCLAPCVGKVSEEEYLDFIAQIRSILKGNISTVLEAMNDKMKEFSISMQFEKAQELKEAIEALKTHQAKSTIVRTSIHDMDVFSYIEEDKYAYVNYLRIVHGAVNQVHTIELERKLDESKESLLSFAILEIRQLVNSHSKEVLVPFYPDVLMDGITYFIPQRGEKKQLLELSERNAKFFKTDRERQRGVFRKEESKFTILNTIKTELRLPRIPHRMECFDNSNIQGTNPVASCVVFIDGKPAKREYRHFHVKTVEGPDDFASMEEIIYRRYHRILDEGKELPDLIVIDGGKGQLHAALNSLEKLGLRGQIPIVGLAKRMEEIYYPGDTDPYLLAKNSLALKTLMHIRDEAHRFGITFHRRLREKGQINSVLSEIQGIGEKTEITLFQHFKTIDAIAKAPLEKLSEVIGKAKAKIVRDYFNSVV
ncbi:excinuclease ABC subunit C [Sanguibacteroides justesenii]|uniref:UvrABC system protein C n=2 Tax=Porphyromonadaceae TaxID=171551 RepID=A0A0C3RDU1_9PORP|nr:excinuclease ABC subunit C [Sanguibacteroides justesenii]KIO45237.1 excinuclease ABC subunit C [Sanguibacteroides justesenii]PXZ44527.1 excinuclease ABC subunit C [Sanguibacteroides justesenii]